jgi:hypothetical protein
MAQVANNMLAKALLSLLMKPMQSSKVGRPGGGCSTEHGILPRAYSSTGSPGVWYMLLCITSHGNRARPTACVMAGCSHPHEEDCAPASLTGQTRQVDPLVLMDYREILSETVALACSYTSGF